MLLSPLQELSTITHGDIRQKQLDCVLQVLHNNGETLGQGWPVVLEVIGAVTKGQGWAIVAYEYSNVAKWGFETLIPKWEVRFKLPEWRLGWKKN